MATRAVIASLGVSNPALGNRYPEAMTAQTAQTVQTVDVRAHVHDAARRARTASRILATLTTAVKDRALHAAADAVLAHTHQILAANAADLDAARAAGTPEAMLDRLALNPQRIDGIAAGLRQVAGLPDPIGEVLRGRTLPNGLQVRQQRVPLGVVGIVYEGRPNVTVDAFGLTLKSGNAVLLRGSSSAANSNAELVTVLRGALCGEGLPEDAVQLLPSADRTSVTHLIQARGLVDVVIPRGGAGLIDAVVRDATVPTIETGVGNCHVYVHADADLDVAERIVLNAKTRRPSVCNAAETLLIDKAVADTAVPRLVGALREGRGHRARQPDRGRACAPSSCRWISRWPSSTVSMRRSSTSTPTAPATPRPSSPRSRRGAALHRTVDAAAVMVNASTAFTDGEQFGFGAEIGISTQKLHARGPMGLPELTSTKWIVIGDGHTRPA